MKIIFLTASFYPQLGGVENHVLNLSLELIKKGHQVTVITPGKKNVNYQNIKIKRFHYLQTKYLGLINIWFNLLKFVHDFKVADIIHIHDVVIWFIPLKLIFPQKKIYATFHGYETKFPIPLKNILIRKISFWFCHKNICIGKYLEKYYYIKATKILYGATYLQNHVIEKDPKLIIYVGRLASDSALDIYLKAFKQLQDFHIVFIGDGPMRKICEKYGPVLGFQKPEKYYQKASFVFTNGYLSIIESMAHRSIVIAAYQNQLKKDYLLTSPFKNQILISDSYQKIVNFINQCQKDSSKRQKCVSRSFKACKTFTYAHLCQEYLNLWQT